MRFFMVNMTIILNFTRQRRIEYLVAAARLILIDSIYLCKMKPLRIWRDFTNALKKDENEFPIRLTD